MFGFKGEGGLFRRKSFKKEAVLKEGEYVTEPEKAIVEAISEIGGCFVKEKNPQTGQMEVKMLEHPTPDAIRTFHALMAEEKVQAMLQTNPELAQRAQRAQMALDSMEGGKFNSQEAALG